MTRAKHRTLILAVSLAVLSTLFAPRFGRVGARAATPITTQAAMLATPVGEQLDWVLAQLNGEAATL